MKSYQQLAAIGALLCATATNLFAAQCTWTGVANDGLWSNSLNWDLLRVPQAGDSVVIRNSTKTVVLTSNRQIKSLRLGGGKNQVTLKINAGSLQCSGASTIEANGILRLWGDMTDGGGLTVKGRVELNGGTFGGGTGAVTIASGGELRIAETNSKSLVGGFRNDGLVSCYSMNLDMTASTGFTNNGIFTLHDQLSLSSDGNGQFLNLGTIATARDSGTVSLTIGCPFTNRGAVNAATNTVLEFVLMPGPEPTVQFSDGTRFGGPGLVRIATGAFGCDGNVGIDGELEIEASQAWGTPVWSGPGVLRWMDGLINNATFAPGLQVEIAPAYEFGPRTQGSCTNLTTIEWRAPGTLWFEGDFNNLGTLVLETNCELLSYSAEVGVVNLGTITTAPDSGTVSLTIKCAFTNYAAVNATSNTVLELVPWFPTGVQFADGTRFGGPGLVRIPQGSFACDGNVGIDGELELAANQTDGAAVWRGPGVLRLVNGAIKNATFASGLQVKIYEGMMRGSCTNLTTMDWSKAGMLWLEGVFNNLGTFALETDCTLYGIGGGAVNLGTITTAPSCSASLMINCPFTNRAAVNAAANTLLDIFPMLPSPGVVFADGSQFGGLGKVCFPYGGMDFECSGNLGVNGELEFGSQQVFGSPVWSGPGILRWVEGTMNNATFAPGLQVEFAATGIKSVLGSCTNQTTVRFVCDSGTSMVGGPFYNQGLFRIEPTWYAAYAIATLPFINDGTLEQEGGAFYVDALTNRGTLNLKSGTLNVQDTLAQTPAGNYQVVLAGPTPAVDFHRLEAGTLAIDGKLTVVLTNGFVPASGNSFLIATNQVRLGQFSFTKLPSLPSNLTFRVQYPSAGVLLEVIERPSMTDWVVLPDGSFQFRLVGSPSAMCEVQVSTNLLSWDTIETYDPFSGSTTFTDTNAPSFGQRYYRADFSD